MRAPCTAVPCHPSRPSRPGCSAAVSKPQAPSVRYVQQARECGETAHENGMSMRHWCVSLVAHLSYSAVLCPRGLAWTCRLWCDRAFPGTCGLPNDAPVGRFRWSPPSVSAIRGSPSRGCWPACCNYVHRAVRRTNSFQYVLAYLQYARFRN